MPHSTRIAPDPNLGWIPLRVSLYDSLDLLPDSNTRVSRRTKLPSPAASELGKGIRISGSKEIRLDVGDQGGTDIEQNLELRASGELLPGVQLDARLSDEQVPLGRQGSSTTLRELDTIRIRVSGRKGELVLGDHDWILAPAIAPGAQRKLRGVTAKAQHAKIQSGATLGSPGARWMRIAYAGVENRQEGWALPGPDGNGLAPVVPYSERVSVDGKILQRDLDYTIRWEEGRLDFLPRQRITATQQIEIEYQSAQLEYQRTLLANANQVELPWGQVRVWGVRESDDKQAPLRFVADSVADSLLRQAGADSLAPRRRDGSLLPLPTSQITGGVAWKSAQDSSRWLSVESRLSRRDQNTASILDTLQDGHAHWLQAGWRFGKYWSQGALGQWEVGFDADGHSRQWHPLDQQEALGSQSDNLWNRPNPQNTGVGQTVVGRTTRLLYRPLRQHEVGLQIGQRQEGESDVRQGIVLHKGDYRVLNLDAQWGWTRNTQPNQQTLDLWWMQQQISLPWFWKPQLQVNGEDRQILANLVRKRQQWIQNQVSSQWTWQPWHLTANHQAQFRLDRRDSPQGDGVPTDSVRSFGANTKLEWNRGLDGLNFLADWRQVEEKLPTGWNPQQSWLGEANLQHGSLAGVDSRAQWKLSLSAFQPTIPLWDTVASGTGTHRWDSLRQEVVPADNGNLRSAGYQTDTTQSPIATTTRSFTLETTVNPGQLLSVRKGVLADIGFHLRGQWEQQDSTDHVQWLPDMDDQSLDQSVEARSQLETEGWWEHDDWRVDVDWRRDRNSWSATSLALRAQTERQMHTSASVLWTGLPRLELRTPVRWQDVVRQGDSWHRREQVRTVEPSLAWNPWDPLRLTPTFTWVEGQGQQERAPLWGHMYGTTLAVAVQLHKSAVLRHEIKRTLARTNEPDGSRLTGGFEPGKTWRFVTGFDWTVSQFLDAHFDWLVRADPNKPIFQKLSMNARAAF